MHYANPINFPAVAGNVPSAPPAAMMMVAPTVAPVPVVQQQQQQSHTSASTFKKISAALPPAPVVVAAPVTNTIVPTPLPKASEEVVGVISAYTNALQNKRKREEPIPIEVNEDNSSTEGLPSAPVLSEEECYAQEQKRIRLEVFDPIMDAFNTGDFDSMTKLVRNSCNEDVKLKLPTTTSARYQGVTPILIFWGLLHETYPDAMTKILEKRISSSTSITCPIQSAEYVYKFHGTRITTKPVLESFAAIMESIGEKELTHDEIVSAVAKQMTSIPPQAYEENECSFIAETVLTFDAENKITEWAYDILAADVR